MSKPAKKITEYGQKTERISEKLDVVNLTSEYEEPGINPENATLEIADFADSLSISYRNFSIHFDMSKLDSRELDSLVKALVKSFEFASIHENTRRER